MPSRSFTDEQLLAYAAGEITGPEASRIEAYLASDDDAAQTVALYRLARRRVLEDDAVDPPANTLARAKAILQPGPTDPLPAWPERLVAAIASLVYDSRLQPAAVRYGETDARIQLTYETDDLDVDLQAERLGDDAARGRDDRWRLTGQVGAADVAGPLEIALHVQGEEEALRVVRSDDRSLFTMELDTGVYELRIRVAGEIVILPNVEIE